ncbi:MAG: VanZ family protein [Romboutsia sp.]
MNKRIYLIAAILWMGLIFYMSNQPATVSAMQSGDLVSFLEKIPYIGATITHLMNIGVGEFVIRKSAHMFLYFVLMILLYMSMYDDKKNIKQLMILSFIYTALYACTDEIHQLFIEGRSGEIRDVMVDSTGALLGGACIYIKHKISK